MTFPNNPGPVQRRQLSDRISRKGWIFAGIIVIVAALLVVAFIWAGNDHSVSSTSNPPSATTGASGGSPSTGSGAPASPGRR